MWCCPCDRWCCQWGSLLFYPMHMRLLLGLSANLQGVYVWQRASGILVHAPADIGARACVLPTAYTRVDVSAYGCYFGCVLWCVRMCSTAREGMLQHVGVPGYGHACWVPCARMRVNGLVFSGTLFAGCCSLLVACFALIDLLAAMSVHDVA